MSNLPIRFAWLTWSLTCPSLACGEGEEKKRKKSARQREGRGENERENCEVGGAALCTNVNPSVSGGGQRASGGQPPSGLFAAVGRGIGRVVHTKLFNGSFITMGWWFTFIRPAAKSLVCIWSLATPPSYSRCARTKPAGEHVLISSCPFNVTDPSWKIGCGSEWESESNLSFRNFASCKTDVLKVWGRLVGIINL